MLLLRSLSCRFILRKLAWEYREFLLLPLLEESLEALFHEFLADLKPIEDLSLLWILVFLFTCCKFLQDNIGESSPVFPRILLFPSRAWVRASNNLETLDFVLCNNSFGLSWLFIFMIGWGLKGLNRLKLKFL